MDSSKPRAVPRPHKLETQRQEFQQGLCSALTGVSTSRATILRPDSDTQGGVLSSGN